MKSYILVIVSLLLIALSFYFGNAIGVSKQAKVCSIQLDSLKASHQLLLDSISLANDDGFLKFDCNDTVSSENLACSNRERVYLDTLMSMELRKCFKRIDDSINLLKEDPLAENLIYWRNVRTRLEQSQLKWELFFTKEQELVTTRYEGKMNITFFLDQQAILDLKNRITSLRLFLKSETLVNNSQ